MSALINALNTSHTENGALTLASSGEDLTNLFFQIGAFRGAEEATILNSFWNAFDLNPTLALRIAFYARDIRGGQGERRTFKLILKALANRFPESINEKFIYWIGHYGRWDDALVLLGTKAEGVLFKIMKLELSLGNALLAKWLPREKSAKKDLAKKIRKGLGLDSKAYRKTLSSLSKVVETQMCAKEWGDIEYSHVPSQAALRYRKAFYRNDEERYEQYLDDVAKGKKEIKAATLYPHQLVTAYTHGIMNKEDATLEAQWKALPNYMEGSECSHIMPIIDVSASMQWGGMGESTPMDIAIGLGIYLSERNVGAFEDHFITFSSTPSLETLSGNSLRQRIYNLKRAHWGMTTDLHKTFRFILDRAVACCVPQEDMPSMLLILSDMEFDEAKENHTNFEAIKASYAMKGYEMPRLVFWNLNCRNDNNFPVRFDQQGTALVSGFSPSIMKHILQGKGELTPKHLMLQVLNSERYNDITI